MVNACDRCGSETDSDYVTTTGRLDFCGWLCDRCGEEFEEWLDCEEKPPVRGGCDSCGGPVETRFRYMGGHRVEVVFNCPKCGWTAGIEGAD